jgi:chromosome segregation ATPase
LEEKAKWKEEEVTWKGKGFTWKAEKSAWETEKTRLERDNETKKASLEEKASSLIAARNQIAEQLSKVTTKLEHAEDTIAKMAREYESLRQQNIEIQETLETERKDKERRMDIFRTGLA